MNIVTELGAVIINSVFLLLVCSVIWHVGYKAQEGRPQNDIPDWLAVLTITGGAFLALGIIGLSNYLLFHVYK